MKNRLKICGLYLLITVLLPGPFALADCPSPQYFAVSELDFRFPLDLESARSAARKAAELWNSAAGRTLFKESEVAQPAGRLLKIEFVYTDKQRLWDMSRSDRAVLKELSSSLGKERASLAHQVERFNSRQQELNTTATSLRSEGERLQHAVAKWNSSPGSQAQLVELQQWQERLKHLTAEFNSKQETLASRRKPLMERLASVSKREEQIRDEVDRYHREFESLVGTHRAGEYELNRSVKTIRVFLFENVTQLEHVIAHEFGHALGIGHVGDKDAVMHYSASPDIPAVSLAPTDLAALRTVCR